MHTEMKWRVAFTFLSWLFASNSHADLKDLCIILHPWNICSSAILKVSVNACGLFNGNTTMSIAVQPVRLHLEEVKEDWLLLPLSRPLDVVIIMHQSHHWESQLCILTYLMNGRWENLHDSLNKSKENKIFTLNLQVMHFAVWILDRGWFKALCSKQ